MEASESLNTENVENSEELRMKESENLQKTPEIKNKWLYLIIPSLAIAFGELMIFSGRITEALEIHAVVLIGLSLSTMFVKDREIQKLYLALVFLPILRLVNLSMPVFYETTLYSFIFIYGLLAIPVSIAVTHQELTPAQLGITFKKLWIYIPFSIMLGYLLGAGEYMIIKTNNLIPNLSIFNLLMLGIVMILFVGLVEEMIFRSILQSRMEIVFGNWKGLIITSVLFGLMHSGYGNINEVLYTSFVGIVIGYLFYRTRSLPLVTLIHGFINFFVFGIFPLLL
jgi:membrane protease YdiL (CAAX protease family)